MGISPFLERSGKHDRIIGLHFAIDHADRLETGNLIHGSDGGFALGFAVEVLFHLFL